MKNKKIFIFSIVIISIFMYVTLNFSRVKNNIKENLFYIKDNVTRLVHYDFDYSWVNDNRLIAHALGGIDGIDYTNSNEAFEFNYGEGFKCFEVDLRLTNDGKLVCLHKTNQWGDIVGGFTLENFSKIKILDKYSVLTIDDVIELMSKNKDIYLITDTKYYYDKTVKAEFEQLIETAKRIDETTLDRIIPQIYKKSMSKTVMNLYNFKSMIYTLYKEDKWDADKVIDTCKKTGIKFITIPIEELTEESLTKFKDAGLIIAVHTINNEEEAGALFEKGINIVYTDFLVPNMFEIH